MRPSFCVHCMRRITRQDPTLIVLDEMNLARIEYYFAEMLSVLEMPSKEEWVLDLVPTAWGRAIRERLKDGKLPRIGYDLVRRNRQQ